jgi:cysteinyl-tRNA synthetase
MFRYSVINRSRDTEKTIRMKSELKIYNSLSREKEVFEPIEEGRVGMYVCGPTVYSDVHLGNCRTFVSFDVIYRYLKYLGYKVRYVRNITDVGHLEGDADIGAEDKISKKARLEQIQPMEIVQRYTNGFHDMMRIFNALPPDIEPRATGHIIEQIEMVQAILDNGYAYVKNGSVYFDTVKFIKKNDIYGKLSGRVVEELIVESREDLKGQDEKNHPSDFAIWIKAEPGHLMRWNAPWSVGYPGWHLECSAMSTKYLGKTFDIHGGGNDLKFPHHENEIAQSVGACGCAPAKYWLHGNMLLLNGRKMAKSEGNSITPQQLFSGDSPHISKSYSPMAIRFFMLQSHYRSTLDLTDEALQAAEKGFRRLMEADKVLQALSHPGQGAEGELDREIRQLIAMVHEEMNDDFNTPKALARLFELVSRINSLKDGHLPIKEITEETLALLKKTFTDFIFQIFGLKDEDAAGGENNRVLDGLIQIIVEMRQEARARKDWTASDKIRDALAELKIQVKDGKEGATWSMIE